MISTPGSGKAKWRRGSHTSTQTAAICSWLFMKPPVPVRLPQWAAQRCTHLKYRFKANKSESSASIAALYRIRPPGGCFKSPRASDWVRMCSGRVWVKMLMLTKATADEEGWDLLLIGVCLDLCRRDNRESTWMLGKTHLSKPDILTINQLSCTEIQFLDDLNRENFTSGIYNSTSQFKQEEQKNLRCSIKFVSLLRRASIHPSFMAHFFLCSPSQSLNRWRCCSHLMLLRWSPRKS